jgi:hypothetical protein
MELSCNGVTHIRKQFCKDHLWWLEYKYVFFYIYFTDSSLKHQSTELVKWNINRGNIKILTIEIFDCKIPVVRMV